MSNTASDNLASPEQIRTLEVLADIYYEDVLQGSDGLRLFTHEPVYPNSRWNWLQKLARPTTTSIAPIATRRIYKPSESTPNHFDIIERDSMWVCDEGHIIVSSLVVEDGELLTVRKHASQTDLQSLDAPSADRAICQVGSKYCLITGDTEGLMWYVQMLQDLDAKSDQTARST